MKRMMIAALAMCLAAPAVAHDHPRWDYILTSRLADAAKVHPYMPDGQTMPPKTTRFATFDDCNAELQVHLDIYNQPGGLWREAGYTWYGVCVVVRQIQPPFWPSKYASETLHASGGPLPVKKPR